MKTKNLNALVAAGCLTFLAPLGAQAGDITPDSPVITNTTLHTETGGSTFSAFTVGDAEHADVILTIDATAGSLSKSGEGLVTLNNNAEIQFSNAVYDVVVGNVNVSSANTVTIDSDSTDKVTMNDVVVNASSGDVTLTLEGVKTSNYNSINNGSNTNDVNFILDDSQLKNVSVNSTQDISVKSINKGNTADTFTLLAGTGTSGDERTSLTLSVSTPSGTPAVDASDLTVAKVSLTDNTSLNLDTVVPSTPTAGSPSDGMIVISELEINGSSSVVTNSNTNVNTKITKVSMGENAAGALSNVTIDEVDLNGNHVLTLANTTINNTIVVDDGKVANIEGTSGTTTFSASLTKSTSTSTPPDKTTLNMSASEGAVVNATSISMNGVSEVNASGAGNVTVGTLSATDTNNTFKNNSTYGAGTTVNTLNVSTGSLDVVADKQLTITTSNLSDAILNLNANSAAINNTTINISDGELDLSGSYKIAITNTNIAADSDTAEITINNTNSNSDQANIGTIDVVVGENPGHTAYFDTSATINSNTAAGTKVDNITVTSSNGKKAEIVLNANAGNITQTATNNVSLTNATLKTGTETGKTISLNGVTISGTEPSAIVVEKGTGTSFGTISLSDGILEVTGLSATDHEFSLTGSNTIKATYSDLGNLPVASAKTLDVYAETAGTMFTDATLEAGIPAVPGGADAQLTTLNLNAHTSEATPVEKSIFGRSIKVQGDNEVNFNGGEIALQTATAGESHIDVAGTNNVLNNNTSSTVLVDGNLTYTDANSEVTLNGAYGFEGTDVDQASTLNTNGNVSLGDIYIDNATDSFVINAEGGQTTVGQFVVTDTGKINVTFNAGDTGTINSIAANELNNGDVLTLSGTGDITLGTVTVNDNASVYNKNTGANTKIGKLVLADDATLNTANKNIADLKLTDVEFADKTKTHTWSLDYDGGSKTADTLTMTDDVASKIQDSLDFQFKNVYNATEDKYIKYVKLVNSDTSVLKTTGTEASSYILSDGTNQIQYSYVNGIEGYDYAPNTVLITNYQISEDILLEHLARQGVREYELSDGIQYAAKTGIWAQPNMQARADAEGGNILTISSTSSISGLDETGGTQKAQIFMVDSTADGIDRTLNLNGVSVNDALSDSTHYMNTGKGSALHVISDDVSSVTVNLNPYYRGVTMPGAADPIEAYKASAGYDALNPDSYLLQRDKTNPELVHVLKDVAFTQNESTGDGGAVYIDGPNSVVNTRSIMTDSTDVDDGVSFTDNVSGANGGALYITNGATFHAQKISGFEIPGTSGEKQDTTGASYMNNNIASAEGGAVYNSGANFLIDGDYSLIQNRSTGNGGGLSNRNGAKTEIGVGEGDVNVNIWRNVAGNAVTPSHGGAIYNEDATVLIGSENSTVEFKANEAFGNGGAHASVNNDLTVKGKTILYGDTYEGKEPFEPYPGKILGNIATGNGGAVSAVESTVTIEGNDVTFRGNIAGGKGGAIYAKGSDTKQSVVNLTVSKKGTFEGNAQGAEYLTGTPGAGQHVDGFCGHIIDDATGEHVHNGGENNAIFLDGDAVLNLNAKGGQIDFKDKIAAANDNNVINLTTSAGGKINFNNKIESTGNNNEIKQDGDVYYNVNNAAGFNGMFNLNSGNAYFTNKNSVPFDNVDYRLNGGSTMHLDNGIVRQIQAKTLDLSGTSRSNPAKLTIDMDLSKEVADSFKLKNSTSGFINVTSIKNTGDTSKEEVFFKIVDQPDDKNKVEVESEVKYIKGDRIDQYEVKGFSQTGKPNGLLISHQDIVYNPQVAVNARLAGQLDLYSDILHRVDEIAETRYFHKVQRNNLYAADPDVLDDRKIDNRYTPYVNQEDGGCTWVKANATIENISPSGQDGYKNRAYNAFIGYEAPVATMKNGWDLINTVFGGYQGSFQDYDSFQNYQNGGSGGYMANLYHNNFFAGGVVMMGGTNVDSQDDSQLARSMNYGLFDIGAAARVGYNVGMGKHWLFQPMLTTSYIYITGVHRHNTLGEEVNMKGTNTIQVAPGFKIVGNYRGWQPYVLFDYTWPIIAKTVANVNDAIDLEDMGLRSYVEYGVGLRKNMGERFMGHVEAVMRNGGRTGISFQGGLVFKF